MSEHTKTPWRVLNGREIIGDDYKLLCEIYYSDRITGKANADFIVKACNNFDSLLAACKAFSNALIHKQGENEANKLRTQILGIAEFRKAANQARTVIAEAEK